MFIFIYGSWREKRHAFDENLGYEEGYDNL